MPTAPIGHQSAAETSRILLLLFILALLVFVLLSFFALYFCRSMFVRRRSSSSSAAAPGPDVTPQPQALDDTVGLDPSLVASFPTFTYAWVKNLHAGKYGLECAVCLSEFREDDVLRLLTACSHVFHTDCIDVWLMSHTTCPYCRHELNPDEKSPPEVRILVAEAADAQEVFEGMRGGEQDEQAQQQLQRRSVSFKEEGEEGRGDGDGGAEGEEGRSRSRDLKRMLRSKSTGHSSMGREDRFTLKLPKDVKERIARERNWTGSCIDFRDLFGDGDYTKDDDDGDIGRSRLSERGGHSRM